MKYTSRELRRRRETDQWKVILTHRGPMSDELVPSCHTVTAKTMRQAEKKRNGLILELERNGAAFTSRMALKELTDSYIRYKEEGGTVECSTISSYKKQSRVITRYLGDLRLSEVTIPAVSGWMSQMMEEGYAPGSVAKPFALLEQMMKYAMAQDLMTKNPCDYCKPPKIQRKKVNSLNREERTRMFKLAREAEPAPLAIAIELALTTGMRRGEICGLRWSDLGECEVTVSHAVSLDSGTMYVKEPKTTDSCRMIPLTKRLHAVLRAMEKDVKWTMAELGVSFDDPFIIGTQELDSRPFHPIVNSARVDPAIRLR